MKKAISIISSTILIGVIIIVILFLAYVVFFKDEEIIPKKTDQLIIGTNLIQLKCDDIKTTDSDYLNKKILIDPGHGCRFYNPETISCTEGDSGYINNNLLESEQVRLISLLLYQKLNKDGFNAIESTRNLEYDFSNSLSKRMQQAQNKDLIISIHAGSNENEEVNTVNAYVSLNSNNLKESKKLSCLILNNLAEEINSISGLTIIPINPNHYDQQDPLQILNANSVAVQLEIGNIQKTENNILVKDISKIADVIEQGILDYYTK